MVSALRLVRMFSNRTPFWGDETSLNWYALRWEHISRPRRIAAKQLLRREVLYLYHRVSIVVTVAAVVSLSAAAYYFYATRVASRIRTSCCCFVVFGCCYVFWFTTQHHRYRNTLLLLSLKGGCACGLHGITPPAVTIVTVRIVLTPLQLKPISRGKLLGITQGKILGQ